MPTNTNQHYIPRVLLKRWCISTPGGLGIFRYRRGESSAKHVPLSQAASAPHFYRDDVDPDHPDSFDEILNQAESRIGPILDKICTIHQIPSSESDDFNWLMRFIYDLHLRAPGQRARLEAAAPSELTRVLSSDFLEQNRPLVELSLSEQLALSPQNKYLAEVFHQTTDATQSLSEGSQRVLHARFAAYPHQRIIDRLKFRSWRLLIAPDAGPQFVFGDDPLVVHDDNANVRTGLDVLRSHVSVPLSPTVVLQGRTSPARTVALLDAAQVRRINGVVARVAYREVFFTQPEFDWQHKAGKIFSSRQWLEGILEATWPSNL